MLSQFSHSIEAMESWQAAPDAPLDHCLERVSRSDLYVCLVAFRYGSLSDEGLSFTHHEYAQARELGKDILPFLMSDSHPFPTAMTDTGAARDQVEGFREELQSNHVCSYFGSTKDLAQKLAISLRSYLIDKQIVTPADIESSWKELSEAWESVDPPDVRVAFNPDKDALALLDDATEAASRLEFLAKHIQESYDTLEADLKQLLRDLDLDITGLDRIHYWENPFINRDWEYVHMGFPNWLLDLRLLLIQIRVKHLEVVAATDKWDEAHSQQLARARNELKRLLKNSARIE